jgi:hypothetical protein
MNPGLGRAVVTSHPTVFDVQHRARMFHDTGIGPSGFQISSGECRIT